MSAAIALNAVVTRQRLIPYYIHHPHLVGHLPSLGFVKPHQRGMNAELLIHSQVKRDIQTLNETVATIGITTEISLTHTCYQIVNTLIAGINSSNGEEEHIPARNKG